MVAVGRMSARPLLARSVVSMGVTVMMVVVMAMLITTGRRRQSGCEGRMVVVAGHVVQRMSADGESHISGDCRGRDTVTKEAKDHQKNRL